MMKKSWTILAVGLSSILCTALLVRAADTPAVEQAKPTPAAETNDPAFDRFCSPYLIGAAWDQMDPGLMTDVALLLQHGESVLGRPRKGVSAEQAFKIAVRLAQKKNDQNALQRLKKGAQRSGNQQLVRFVASTEQLADSSRVAVPDLMVSIDDITPGQYATLRMIRDGISRAVVSGNQDILRRFKNGLPKYDGLPPDQKRRLQQLIDKAQSTVPAEPVVDSATTDALDLLAARSRDGDDDDTEKADEPANVTGGY
jgi:hypothetical protein